VITVGVASMFTATVSPAKSAASATSTLMPSFVRESESERDGGNDPFGGRIVRFAIFVAPLTRSSSSAIPASFAALSVARIETWTSVLFQPLEFAGGDSDIVKAGGKSSTETHAWSKFDSRNQAASFAAFRSRRSNRAETLAAGVAGRKLQLVTSSVHHSTEFESGIPGRRRTWGCCKHLETQPTSDLRAGTD